MRLRCVFLIIIAMTIVGCPMAGAAESGRAGNVHGGFSLLYGDYDSSRRGAGAGVSANYFVQQYFLLWGFDGILNGGRAGRYALNLGYEWTSISSNWSNDTAVHVDSGKMLYDANILVAPGGLPFRFKFYTRDNKKTVPLYDTQRHGNNSQLGVVDNISNGTRWETGATLVLGIKNGSYLGAYRDILSQWPRVVLDFKQIYIKDTKAIVPINIRQRDLAFISLNKKDNWFHYRFSDYEDRSGLPGAADNNYENQTVLLGTIDQYSRRQWINLTNWIKLSADGSYTVHKPRGEAVQTYYLNAYAKMSFANSTLEEFSGFSREREGEALRTRIELPVYWYLRPKSGWQMSNSILLDYYQEQQYLRLKPQTTQTSTVRSSIDYLYFRGARLKLAFQGGRVEDSGSVNQNASVTLDAEKKGGRLGELDWRAGYGLTYFDSDTGTQLTEHRLSGKVSVDKQRWKWGTSEDVFYSLGSYTSEYRGTMRPGVSTTFDGQESTQTNKSFRSQTTMFAETSWSTVREHFDAGYGYQKQDGNVDTSWSLAHTAIIDRQSLIVSLGNNLSSYVENQNYELAASMNTGGSWQLRNSLSLKWFPAKSFVTRIHGAHSLTKTTVSYLCDETMTLRGFTVNGVVRTLWNVEQYASLERLETTNEINSVENYYKMQLSGSYFPTAHLSVDLTSRYMFRDNASGEASKEWLMRCQVGANYEKMQANVSYNRNLNITSNVLEERWEASIRKTF